MALQGTLETFALDDVFHLLASTHKTGCYQLDGPRGSGKVWFVDGEIVAAEATGASVASPPVEVVFELLRFEDGTFVFDAEAAPTSAGTPVGVERCLEQAGVLLEEWRDIAAVVPSLDLDVSLNPELPDDEVTIRADRWIAVVAIGGGTTVRRMGDRLHLGELAVSRLVKELVELGVVRLGEAAPVPFQAEPEPALEETPVLSLVEEPADDEADVLHIVPAGDDTFDPDALVIDEPRIPTSMADIASSAPPAEEIAGDGAEPDPADAAEIARQLANLSPRAAKAVAAAAKASTQEEREAMLAQLDDEEENINRDLLVKFLGSVNS
ncbi:MAG: DUF4388 domain-containing protein [Acidimicrobiales bacterium]|nr:DUF4388 domain-containing protein [Acidimicrobiales bacterium]